MSDDNNDDDGAFFISCSQIIYKHSDWCGGKEFNKICNDIIYAGYLI